MDATHFLIARGDQNQDVGTGSGFGRAVLIVAGVSALVACLLTAITTLLQAKNYRKPLLQRHVVRIFMLVPIFSAASWASLISLRVAFWIEPFRDVYEAFTLYTFFQLLVNFLGGERALIIMMHGRPPVSHLWPLDKLPGVGKVDISDPHTFLSIKRGILQYAWIKPVLSIATIALKATGTFKEGIISWDSGYFWTGLIYNVSICWSLYDLALFWLCMTNDLQPFRPMPKFLCIKGIIFASWWQGFFLSILVWLGAIPSVGGNYTADNLAAAIQDALICFEMPFFALSHWYAFSWKDYADRTISDARMPMQFALRDAFGPRDLIEDAKETWSGQKYEYRYFDAEDNVMAHEESSSRQARMAEGMRYERGGRGKYWIPSPGGENAKQPLLSRWADSHARTMSPGDGGNGESSRSRERAGNDGYGATNSLEELELDAEEERLYGKARELEFGDWNYPVVDTNYATREDRLRADPNTISSSTNRAILHPTRDSKRRRASRLAEIRDDIHQHDRPASADRPSTVDKLKPSHIAPGLTSKARQKMPDALVRHSSSTSSSSSAVSHSSQLVDLVVKDTEAENIERVRARKEGGPGWNTVNQEHFLQTFPNEAPEEGREVVRRGFNPDRPERGVAEEVTHTLTEDGEEGGSGRQQEKVSDIRGKDEVGEDMPWEERRLGADGSGERSPFEEERNVWGRD